MQKIKKIIEYSRTLKVNRGRVKYDISQSKKISIFRNNYFYQRKEESISKKNIIKIIDYKYFEDFDISYDKKIFKYYFLRDIQSKITISKIVKLDNKFYYYNRCYRNISDINIEKVKSEINMLLNHDYAVKKISGNCIISPLIIVPIIERLSFSLSSIFLIDNVTFTKLNQKLFDNNISLYDIPRLRGGFSYRHFDDFLYKTRKTILIKNGYINDYLKNLSIDTCKFGNVYYDKFSNEFRSNFTNLFLKIKKNRIKINYDYLLEDSLTPLNIDILTGTIEGEVIAKDLRNDIYVIGKIETNYKNLFDSMGRIGKYCLCNSHKVSYVTTKIGE